MLEILNGNVQDHIFEHPAAHPKTPQNTHDQFEKHTSPGVECRKLRRMPGNHFYTTPYIKYTTTSNQAHIPKATRPN
jgi:hypothetical protein